MCVSIFMLVRLLVSVVLYVRNLICSVVDIDFEKLLI